MKLKFVSGLIQIASLRFIEALEGSKITKGNIQFSRMLASTSRVNCVFSLHCMLPPKR